MVIVFSTGLGVGWFWGASLSTAAPRTVLRESGYHYIKPVLLCNTNVNLNENEDMAMVDKLNLYIKQKQQDDISVYFLQLLNGPRWAGVNENDTYAPASMLKVPTMVAILKYADSHDGFLSKEIYYDGSFDDNKAEYFKPAKSLQAGRYYTVDQLLTYMIGYSDNNAARLLDGAVDRQSLANIYINLGIQLPPDTLDFMSTKTYSLFLRVLFNSTYLTREMSEKALKLLTMPDFPQGIQAGVASSTEVAQKFGERQVFQPDGTLIFRELHDCGIVYTSSPYILCVMTRGKDFSELTTVLHDVSNIVYASAATP